MGFILLVLISVHFILIYVQAYYLIFPFVKMCWTLNGSILLIWEIIYSHKIRTVLIVHVPHIIVVLKVEWGEEKA